jgi:hypothetical protein
MKTKSEALFEDFLNLNGLAFERIEEATSPRPDYLVSAGSLKVVFELKELAEDKEFGTIKDPAYPHLKSNSRKIGEHVRRRIESSRKQVQQGANTGLPSVLLIYNSLDPLFQAFGTEPHDFTAAMYGDYTVLIDRETRQSDWFNGKGQMLQENKNTSFSAVGHLSDRYLLNRGKVVAVALFENVFAKFPLLYEQLPACFEVTRVSVSREPLALR